jgi:hypothetical protein
MPMPQSVYQMPVSLLAINIDEKKSEIEAGCVLLIFDVNTNLESSKVLAAIELDCV